MFFRGEEMSRRLLKKGAKNGYIFDKMGYVMPRLNDKTVMDAVRIVTTQTPVVAKVLPIGEPYRCHWNAVNFAERLGGKAVRGYRVDLSASGILEVYDHSVVQIGDKFIDVTPYYGITKSMFVGSDRDLPEFRESIIHPRLPQYGVNNARTKPNFNIPLTREAQDLLDRDVASISARVEAARLWEEGVLNRAHIIVVRF